MRPARWYRQVSRLGQPRDLLRVTNGGSSWPRDLLCVTNCGLDGKAAWTPLGRTWDASQVLIVLSFQFVSILLFGSECILGSKSYLAWKAIVWSSSTGEARSSLRTSPSLSCDPLKKEPCPCRDA